MYADVAERFGTTPDAIRILLGGTLIPAGPGLFEDVVLGATGSGPGNAALFRVDKRAPPPPTPYEALMIKRDRLRMELAKVEADLASMAEAALGGSRRRRTAAASLLRATDGSWFV